MVLYFGVNTLSAKADGSLRVVHYQNLLMQLRRKGTPFMEL
jgi:hypothetical protein